MTWGLPPGPLSQKLEGKKPQTEAELKENVGHYLRQEEGDAIKQAYLNTMTASATKHHSPSSHHPETPSSSILAGTSDVGNAHKDILDLSKGMIGEIDDQMFTQSSTDN